MSNNTYITEPLDKNNNKIINFNEEMVEIECICDKSTYTSKEDIIQCILCHKYQHLECIYQAQYTEPYLCFNCQFKNNHFYLKWKKTILPAREIIYKKKWEEDKNLLKEGTKTFEFNLNLEELNSKYNRNNNNSHYIAFLCLTNNGKPLRLGFPYNIKIHINNNKFYFTKNKCFKRPLLLALDNTPHYVPKERHLITSDKYSIPNANDFFNSPRNTYINQDKYNQKVIISFADLLENYRGSEFEFVDIRHYIFYVGLFQEIKIPQTNIFKNTSDLKHFYDIFKNLYNEKVLKLKWNKISNYVTLGDEEMNMNLISYISNQKILHPIRGLFCQHSDVLDYGECCGYITSNSQVYKCFKCNKPLNIMYIDDMSENIFNKYKDQNYSQIYYTSNFKFIKGDPISDIKEKNGSKNEEELKNEDNVIDEDESFSESFFDYYNKNNNNEKNGNDEIIELNSSDDSKDENEDTNNNNNDNIIIELNSSDDSKDENVGTNNNNNDNIKINSNNDQNKEFSFNSNINYTLENNINNNIFNNEIND